MAGSVITMALVVSLMAVSIVDPAPQRGRGRGQAREPVAITWTSLDLRRAAGGDVEHVTELLLRDGGRTVWAAFYGRAESARLASSSDDGTSWTIAPVRGLKQVRSMVELPDGAVLFGGSSERGQSPLVRLAAGSTVGGRMTWESCGTGRGSADLPGPSSDTVWDVVADPSGAIYIATGSQRNNPDRRHTTVFRSEDGCRTLTALAPLPGMGTLALAVDPGGRVLVSTGESAEHEDADAAGQARIYYSDDRGRSWRESGRLEGANRVYRLTVLRDGTILAGSGIRGVMFRSNDRGASWTATTHVPSGTRMFGVPPAPKEVPATRVYAILELADGDVVVGTGNAAGDVFVTSDRGATWRITGQTGPNIVCWAITQAPDGRVWIGTGSRGGDVLVGRVVR